MSTLATRKILNYSLSDYPTSDGKPMAETDWHRELMVALIQTLQGFFASQPMVYVSGNLLVFYERGNRRRHLAPDVFVVKGITNHERPNYLIWEEGKSPNFVVELTSSSTRDEDMHEKFQLYQNTLKVQEYFLFDPLGDYLNPQLQGFRLRKEKYRRIRSEAGRLVSKVLGLHLEPHSRSLRLWNPDTNEVLLTPAERAVKAEEQLAMAKQELERLRRQNRP